jgi:hypothetical protein
MGKVPFALGASQAMTAEDAARVAVTLVGAVARMRDGADAEGVSGAEAAEAADSPTELVATTVKV